MAHYLPWTVPPFCKGRLGGIFYSLKDRLQTRFVATLVGRRNARLSILAARDPWSVGRRMLLVRVPNAELRRVRRPVLLPVHKNQRCSCRWVFAYRIARQEFVFAATGTLAVARRRSDFSARSELWF